MWPGRAQSRSRCADVCQSDRQLHCSSLSLCRPSGCARLRPSLRGQRRRARARGTGSMLTVSFMFRSSTPGLNWALHLAQWQHSRRLWLGPERPSPAACPVRRAPGVETSARKRPLVQTAEHRHGDILYSLAARALAVAPGQGHVSGHCQRGGLSEEGARAGSSMSRLGNPGRSSLTPSGVEG